VAALVSWDQNAAAKDDYLSAAAFFNVMGTGQSVSAAISTLHAAGYGTSSDNGVPATLGYLGDGSVTLSSAATAGSPGPKPVPATNYSRAGGHLHGASHRHDDTDGNGNPYLATDLDLDTGANPSTRARAHITFEVGEPGHNTAYFGSRHCAVVYGSDSCHLPGWRGDGCPCDV